jgi:5-methyltetrahydrofolate--homocysteine methyltransferase
METIAAGNLLVKRDRSATAFIAFFSHREGKKEEKATEKEAIPQDQMLRAAIIRGEENTASSLASAHIESGMPSMKLINEVLVPALNVVGELYECGDYFLPQLMNSAKAAQAAFAALEKGFSAGEKSLQKGTIVMATVEGDLHDIGIEPRRLGLKEPWLQCD